MLGDLTYQCSVSALTFANVFLRSSPSLSMSQGSVFTQASFSSQLNDSGNLFPTFPYLGVFLCSGPDCSQLLR